jgi:hypothetical protein
MQKQFDRINRIQQDSILQKDSVCFSLQKFKILF